MKNPVRTTLLLVVGSMVVAALCLGTPSTARAAGLGELRLLSELGQPLNAEIEIVSAPADGKDFSARLAPSVYHAGADVDPALSGIRFKVVRHGARSVLRLSTRQPVNAPYLELPVELRSNTTRLTRQYTVLLNPPFFKHRQRIAIESLRSVR
jgi:pilus assembly protein FimV